jgi:hypothetical protein
LRSSDIHARNTNAPISTPYTISPKYNSVNYYPISKIEFHLACPPPSMQTPPFSVNGWADYEIKNGSKLK